MTSAQTSLPDAGPTRLPIAALLVSDVAKSTLLDRVPHPALAGGQYWVSPPSVEIDAYLEASLPGHLSGCSPGREANRGS